LSEGRWKGLAILDLSIVKIIKNTIK